MIVDEKGSFKTLRQYPKLALIDLSIDGDNFVFNPRQSKKAPLKVPISPKGLTLKKCRFQPKFLFDINKKQTLCDALKSLELGNRWLFIRW